MQSGLQWTAQIPTDNPATYLDGTNGHARLYRPLLPSAWLNLRWDRSMLEFSFDPFYSNLVPYRPYRRQQSFDSTTTTVVNNLQSTVLSKLFGFAAGAGYSSGLSDKWWVGGGFGTIWWTHALVTTYALKIEQPTRGNRGQPIIQNLNTTAPLPISDWNNFSTFQLDVYAQLLYHTTNGFAGFRAGFPFTTLSRNQSGPSAPLRLELFYRLPLLTRQIRAATPQEE